MSVSICTGDGGCGGGAGSDCLDVLLLRILNSAGAGTSVESQIAAQCGCEAEREARSPPPPPTHPPPRLASVICDAPAGARARRTNGDGGEGGGEDGGDDGGEGGGEGPPLVAGLAGTATQRTATEAAEEGAS